MTLQIALVGTDGIVLASDLKFVSTFHNQFETSLTSKFTIERGLVVMWAGDFFPARDLAREALKLNDEQMKSPDLLLEEKARKIFSEARQTLDFAALDGEIVLVSKADLTTIHHVTAKGERFSHIRFRDKAISGHHANPACSYIQLFYEKRPAAELVPLVAHTILSAARFNPAGIEGLKIFLCTKDGIAEVPEERIAELTLWSESLHSTTRQGLYERKTEEKKNPLLDDELDWTDKDLEKLRRKDSEKEKS